jgi:poly-gamma-glutamate synthesis protein (capsule biosynthesis protein)
VVAGGDVMLGRWIGRKSRMEKDWAWPFRLIHETLAGADVAFVNLESPFCEKGPYEQPGMVFRARPEMIEGLALAGVDVVSVANNHARDAGAAGLEFTLKHLEAHGIAAAGLEGGALVERARTRFRFLAYTYDQRNGNWAEDDARIQGLDVKRMRADVAGAAARGETVIVSMHAGVEYASKPHATQRGFARAAIEAGAAAVAGHHPHVTQEAEEHRGGVIFYSLGNLAFDQFHRKDTQRGALAELEFEDGKLRGWRLRETALAGGRPQLA